MNEMWKIAASVRAPFLGSLAVTSLVALTAGSSLAASLVEGTTVVARETGHAAIVFNATPIVKRMTEANASAATIDDRLERQALLAIVERLRAVEKSDDVTVRIVYDRSGDVSPAYGSFPSQLIELYAQITIRTADAEADRDRWQEAASGNAALPAWVPFKTIGALPPR